jgi:flagellar biosynthesis protein FlhB
MIVQVLALIDYCTFQDVFLKKEVLAQMTVHEFQSENWVKKGAFGGDPEIKSKIRWLATSQVQQECYHTMEESFRVYSQSHFVKG